MEVKHFKDKLSVTAIGITMPLVDYIPDSEGLISYQARVSNAENQLNFDTADKLLAYCARHGHWSIFDMSNLVLEIKAPRDISRQVLRHGSAKFQEFSQRYADVTSDMFCLRELRKEDTKNRQNSIANAFSVSDENEWYADQEYIISEVNRIVAKWRERKAAKECTRVFMPEGLTMSAMYMNGTVRTWIHYTGLRKKRGETQDEHCDVADKCREYLLQHFPSLCKVLEEQQT